MKNDDLKLEKSVFLTKNSIFVKMRIICENIKKICATMKISMKCKKKWKIVKNKLEKCIFVEKSRFPENVKSLWKTKNV